MVAKTVSNIKIGVVDDHVQTAISLSQLLEYNGFKTFQAYNVEEALSKAKKEKPDLLLVDIRLGEDEEGYGIAKDLPKQKILFMSGYDLQNTKIKVFNNVVGVLKKPIAIADLLGAIKKEFKLPKFKEL